MRRTPLAQFVPFVEPVSRYDPRSSLIGTNSLEQHDIVDSRNQVFGLGARADLTHDAFTDVSVRPTA